MTFVKGQNLPITEVTTAYSVGSSPEGIWKEPWMSGSGTGHSDIRGFGLLLTDRSMVRRERCRLIAWITVSGAIIGLSQIARTSSVLRAPSRYLPGIIYGCFSSPCLPLFTVGRRSQGRSRAAVRSSLDFGGTL